MSAKKYRLETSAFQMQHEVTHSLVIIYLSVNSVFGLQIWPVDCVVVEYEDAIDRNRACLSRSYAAIYCAFRKNAYLLNALVKVTV